MKNYKAHGIKIMNNICVKCGEELRENNGHKRLVIFPDNGGLYDNVLCSEDCVIEEVKGFNKWEYDISEEGG